MKSKHLKEDKKSKNIKNKNQKIKEDKELKKHHKILFTIIVMLMIIIIAAGISIGISANNWKTTVQEMTKNENSIVKDKDGNVIAKIGSEKAKNKISASEIPTNLKNAYVAIEDERFYKHHGVDVKRTGGAIVSYVFHRGSS